MTSQLLNFSKSLTSLKNVAYRALLIKQTECIKFPTYFTHMYYSPNLANFEILKGLYTVLGIHLGIGPNQKFQ